jgi:hypothetical protein
MTPEPDYSKCSIAELYDVLNHIDGDKFPQLKAVFLAFVSCLQLSYLFYMQNMSR